MEIGNLTEEEAEAKLTVPVSQTITYEKEWPQQFGGWTGSHQGI